MLWACIPGQNVVNYAPDIANFKQKDIEMIQHLAIIMDGNGRWAEQRGLSRSEGHRAGARAISGVARAALKAGIRYMTVYAFSTENWKRPKAEVTTLMGLDRKSVV